jgi:hypothetical protein
VIVRDVSTRVVRVLTTVASPRGIANPVIAPKGLDVAWAMYDGIEMRIVKGSTVTGVVTSVKFGLVPDAFLDDGTLLAHDTGWNASTITLVNGFERPITGIPREARHPVVSGGHSQVAWARLDTTVAPGAPRRSALQVAPLLAPAQASGTGTVGAPVTLTGTAYDDQPSFTPDRSRLYWVRSTGVKGAPGDIWSAPADLSAPAAAVAQTTGDETDVSVVTTDDGTPPGALTSVSGFLHGRASGLSWTSPPDADLSGAVVVRTLDGVVQRTAFVPGRCGTPGYCFDVFTDSGLVLGKTYEYRIAPVDRSNHYGPETTRKLTAAAADIYFTNPTSWSSATASFPITFGPVAAPGVRFTVSVNDQGWLQDVPQRTAIYAGVPGGTYIVDVTVDDAYGNSGHDHLGYAVVPRDQTIATFTGGANVYDKNAFLGSYRKLWHPGDLARVKLWGYRVQIVGATCPTCGAFDLYDKGQWLARIDTYSRVTHLRRVVYTWYFRYGESTTADHAYTIKPVATGSRRDVVLDGFATL